MAGEIEKIQEKLIKFREERDWKKFHTPKDLAISVTLEAAELIEHFQWKSPGEIEEYIKKHKEKISDEVADVAIYLLNLCIILDIDLISAINRKIEKNIKRYPASKFKGVARREADGD